MSVHRVRRDQDKWYAYTYNEASSEEELVEVFRALSTIAMRNSINISKNSIKEMDVKNTESIMRRRRFCQYHPHKHFFNLIVMEILGPGLEAPYLMASSIR